MKLLLAAEAAWFGASYIRSHTDVEQRPVIGQPENSGGEKEVYGVGYEADSGFFFWFHSRTEESNSD